MLLHLQIKVNHSHRDNILIYCFNLITHHTLALYNYLAHAVVLEF